MGRFSLAIVTASLRSWSASASSHSTSTGIPFAAAPVADLAAKTVGVETALKQKRPTAAEALAREALRLTEQSLGTESLEVVNLYSDGLSIPGPK